MLGVNKMIQGDIWNYEQHQFDTLLMLMNGIGIVGKLKQLIPYLVHLKTLLNPGGQILLDSSDLTYLNPHFSTQPELGEIGYQYEYKGIRGPWFNWLYVGEQTLMEHAEHAGFTTEILLKNNEDQYLACLTPN